MAREQYTHGFASQASKPVYAGDDLVVRLIVLGGVENTYEKMVIQTLSGRVLLRSLDGRKSSRAQVDIFFDPAGNIGPDIINIG